MSIKRPWHKQGHWIWQNEDRQRDVLCVVHCIVPPHILAGVYGKSWELIFKWPTYHRRITYNGSWRRQAIRLYWMEIDIYWWWAFVYFYLLNSCIGSDDDVTNYVCYCNLVHIVLCLAFVINPDMAYFRNLGNMFCYEHYCPWSSISPLLSQNSSNSVDKSHHYGIYAVH
jgi:hypothetical protein